MLVVDSMLVLKTRSVLEPGDQHGAGIRPYPQDDAIRTHLAQSVMELHRDTLGTRWWPFLKGPLETLMIEVN